jgi:hypothetical protein
MNLNTSAFDEIRPDEYSEATEARELGAMLIERVAEHAHLGDALIGYIFRDDELRRHGKVTYAEAILVERVLQSDKRWGRLVKWAILRILPDFGETPPDFLILIDRNIWEGMDIEAKVALIDHELLHASFATEDDGVTQKFHQDGTPWWAIRGHDLEAFAGEVTRNGLWNEDLANFARAVVDRLADEAADESAVA